MSNFKTLRLFILSAIFVGCGKTPDGILNLSGKWEVSLDSLRTFQEINLPGTTDMAGLGTPNALTPELKKPQVLHLTRKHAFIGEAWYRRTIHIPETMANRPLTLSLERVMWQSRLWIDGTKHSAEEESLTTPHRYHIPEGLSAGEHELLLCIDNRKRYDISVKELAHAYTEDTQVKWNGILGEMSLKAENPVKIHRVDIFPDVETRSVKSRITLVRTAADVESSSATLTLRIAPSGEETALVQKSFPATIDRDTIRVEHTIHLGDKVCLWDEFSPALYTLKASCTHHDYTDEQTNTFGLREIGNTDGHLTINGNRIFLRGTLECCIFPLTGTPPMDSASWKELFTKAKAWGLNHLRFHSWCPPEAAFTAADELGIYLQIELPNWSLSVGRDSLMNRFLYGEYDRIISQYGNHPSFCLMTAGNELQPDFSFLNSLVGYMKEQDDRHLYSTTTFTFERGHGRKPEPEDEFFVSQWTNHGWIRGQGVFEAEAPNFNKDYRSAARDIDVPLISHEIGQYAVYPNLKEIEKYSGTLIPLNFMAIKEDLEKKGLTDKAESFLMASGKLAALLYKEEIERAMKTPQFSGFQLLDLHDFPGQGTALVGLLDAFWDSKGLIAPHEFRQFCAPVVPLARFDKATYSGDEEFAATVEIANYSGKAIEGEEITWTMKASDSSVISRGTLPYKTLEQGTVTPVGKLHTRLSGVNKADKLTLEISIKGTDWKNKWSVWVYPETRDMPTEGIVLTADTDEALRALDAGEKVLFSPKRETVKGLEGKFLPVFWSPVHFPEQAGTMGLLCSPQHPALRHFPTDIHTDWQWWHIVKQSKTMVTDSLPDITPIVEVIDNFANNRRLAAIFEAQCGKGKLLMSSMELLPEQNHTPEAGQLLYSLLRYMNSEEFSPSGSITPKAIRSLTLEE